MKFKLENLPKIVQSEVFKYVDADELFELRFLNKHIFDTIHPIIYEYLCYSTYYYTYDGLLNKVQRDFINKNPSKIKHLVIISRESLDYLRIDENIRTLADIQGSSYLNNHICDQYTNLKSIDICIEHYKFHDISELILNYYRKLLIKVDEFSIYTDYDVNLDSLFSLLNPNKLKVLKIKAKAEEYEPYEQWITLSDISKFSQFKYLECLDIYTNRFEIESNHQSNSNTEIFPALKSLNIYIPSFDYKIFNNIPHLEVLYLYDYDCDDYETRYEILKDLEHLIEKSVPKIYLNSYTGSSPDPFYVIEIGLNHLSRISIMASKISLLISGAKNKEWEGKFIDIPLFLNVEQIEFSGCDLNIHCIFNMLEYFPNIQKVTFKNGKLFTYSNTPLSLPNNPESFLFRIKKKNTEFNDKHTILSLLDAVPTYIY